MTTKVCAPSVGATRLDDQSVCGDGGGAHGPVSKDRARQPFTQTQAKSDWIGRPSTANRCYTLSTHNSMAPKRILLSRLPVCNLMVANGQMGTCVAVVVGESMGRDLNLEGLMQVAQQETQI